MSSAAASKTGSGLELYTSSHVGGLESEHLN